MPSYIRRRWNESRGDEYDAWGESWWYFEVEPDGAVLRQIERYDSGDVLKYSAAHNEDRYGALAKQRLRLNESGWQSITDSEFEGLWRELPATNSRLCARSE